MFLKDTKLQTKREIPCSLGFPGSSDGKETAYNEGNLSSIPGSGRSPGEGNDNPLQYFCLVNPMDRGTWRKELDMTEREGDDRG